MKGVNTGGLWLEDVEDVAVCGGTDWMQLVVRSVGLCHGIHGHLGSKSGSLLDQRHEMRVQRDGQPGTANMATNFCEIKGNIPGNLFIHCRRQICPRHLAHA